MVALWWLQYEQHPPAGLKKKITKFTSSSYLTQHKPQTNDQFNLNKLFD